VFKLFSLASGHLKIDFHFAFERLGEHPRRSPAGDLA
jgi:hypothetical protein